MYKSILAITFLMFPVSSYADTNTYKDSGLPKTDSGVDITKRVSDPFYYTDDTPTGGATDILKRSGDIIHLAKTKKYFAMSAACIWLLMFFIKIGRKNFTFMQKMSRRWLYIIVALLTAIATVLTKFQANVSWGDALIVLTSGPFAAYINDLVKRGVFNKTPSKDTK
jgi:hypothetical protein